MDGLLIPNSIKERLASAWDERLVGMGAIKYETERNIDKKPVGIGVVASRRMGRRHEYAAMYFAGTNELSELRLLA